MASNFSNFIVYYKLSDSSFRTLDYKNQQFKTIKKLFYDCNQFELLTKSIDEHNDESLKSYENSHKKFIKDTKIPDSQ